MSIFPGLNTINFDESGTLMLISQTTLEANEDSFVIKSAVQKHNL